MTVSEPFSETIWKYNQVWCGKKENLDLFQDIWSHFDWSFKIEQIQFKNESKPENEYWFHISIEIIL